MLIPDPWCICGDTWADHDQSKLNRLLVDRTFSDEEWPSHEEQEAAIGACSKCSCRKYQLVEEYEDTDRYNPSMNHDDGRLDI